MHALIPRDELPPSPGGTVTFQGEAHGSGVSFFLVNNEPGAGPDLHKHPCSETWIVRAGRARITADGEQIDWSSGPCRQQGPIALPTRISPSVSASARSPPLWMRARRVPGFPAFS